MYQVDLSSLQTLEEYYNTLQKLQEEAHGKEYCSHHNLICDNIDEISYLKDKRTFTYRELGTHQGASLAAVLLKLKDLDFIDSTVESYDIDLSLLSKHFHIFSQFLDSQDNMNYVISEISSLDKTTYSTSCDILLIDTKHTYDHVFQELTLHAPAVNYTIFVHDTVGYKDVYKAIESFLKTSEGKKFKFHNDTRGYGCGVLTRYEQ